MYILGQPEVNEENPPTDDNSSSSDDENSDDNDDDNDNENDKPKKKKRKSGRINSGLFSSHKFLFGVIFSRCKDSSALVRAKALSTLAEVTGRADENPVIADVIKNLVDPTLSPNDEQVWLLLIQ